VRFAIAHTGVIERMVVGASEGGATMSGEVCGLVGVVSSMQAIGAVEGARGKSQ
jgi:hypothetical protein